MEAKAQHRRFAHLQSASAAARGWKMWTPLPPTHQYLSSHQVPEAI